MVCIVRSSIYKPKRKRCARKSSLIQIIFNIAALAFPSITFVQLNGSCSFLYTKLVIRQHNAPAANTIESNQQHTRNTLQKGNRM